MSKISVRARTWRNVAYINLRIPCSGDWGWYCYPADTMYDDERGEWTTAKRFYTEITIKLENPSDPDVAKSYGVDAQMKILVKDNGKKVHANDFNRGKQVNGTGFLSRPEYPEPPLFLR